MLGSKKSVFMVSFLLAVFLSSVTLSFGDQSPKIYVSVDELIQDLGGNWEETFVYVRDHVRFEPSTYCLRSSQGVLWGSSGNAKEQAILLLDILETLGEEARLVSGRLDGEKSVLLINSFFPQGKRNDFSYADDVLISQPSAEEDVLSNVRDHFWIQIHKDDRWLDLDPVFPDAVPGKGYAKVEKTYPVQNEDFFPKMMISLSVEKEGTREDVLMMEEKLQTLSNQPVTLSISTSFQESEKEGKSGGSPGGAFGALSRSASGEKKAKGLEAVYLAELKIGEGREVSGEFKEEIPNPSKKTPVENPIKRIWLNFRLTGDGKVLLERERVLFERIREADELPLFHRHSILVTANAIPLEVWEGKLQKVSDPGLLEKIRTGVEEIKSGVKSKKDRKILLSESISLEEEIGPELGHLINMIFAYSSDSLTENAGDSLSVFSYLNLPRIIIYSVEGDGKTVATSMDLRHDSVSAVPYPGQALGMAETFLYGRGVFEFVLEGKVLELFGGKKALTTAFIMEEAARRKVPIRFYSEIQKHELEKLAMPDHVRNRALLAIESGSILIVPEQSVLFEGKDRWGWWQVDPMPRETIGVLDTGLHQAMLQRTILDTEGMLNSKMGFAIGAITGAVDTQWMLAHMVLKYGELNKAALQEIKAYIKQIKEYMCPEFEKSVSKTLAFVTVIDIEDCYKKEYSLGFKAGVKIEMGWCQAFAKGFGCSSTSILNYYLSQYE
jgi:hypothetical protein